MPDYLQGFNITVRPVSPYKISDGFCKLLPQNTGDCVNGYLTHNYTYENPNDFVYSLYFQINNTNYSVNILQIKHDENLYPVELKMILKDTNIEETISKCPEEFQKNIKNVFFDDTVKKVIYNLIDIANVSNKR